MVRWKTNSSRQAAKDEKARSTGSLGELLKPIVLILLLLGFMYLVFTNSGFIKGLVSGYGLLGLFVASIIANATVLLPMPIDLLFLAISAETLTLPEVLLVGIILGSGAAIGEMTAYIAGTLGSKAIKALGISEFGKIDEIKDRIGEKGMYFIFIGALVPFPFDLIGIAAGIVRYDWKRFFVAALLGKTGRYLLIGTAGYFGFTAIKAIFGLG